MGFPIPKNVVILIRLMHASFQLLQKNQGGLLSFNQFLSTSEDMLISQQYAEGCLGDPDTEAVLFKIKIDSSTKSSPFAAIGDLSHFGESESEVLFSIHTIFRINDIELLDSGVWQVQLSMTSDGDEQLNHLKDNRSTTERSHKFSSFRSVNGAHR